MLTCAISDRHLFTGTEPDRHTALLAQLRRLSSPHTSVLPTEVEGPASPHAQPEGHGFNHAKTPSHPHLALAPEAGPAPSDEERTTKNEQRPVTLFQLREKDLPSPALARLLEVLRAALPHNSPTQLLLNGPPALAAAHGAHGVHLPSGWSPASVAAARAAFPGPATISASAHTLAEAALAPIAGLDVLLFGPVFEKSIRNTTVAPGTGLPLLAAAVRAAQPVPVLALGGITPANTPSCLAAGAAGIAAIRLFLPDATPPSSKPISVS